MGFHEHPAAARQSATLPGMPCWATDGRDWPNRSSSFFATAANIRWHVQQLGRGPVLLLVHGAGAATHSWRSLAPLLARHFTVVAPDLPGHGFTDTPHPGRLSLPSMAEDLAALLRVLGHRPALVAGHSAGAAVLARMCLDGRAAPAGLIALNGALLPHDGAAGRLLPAFARMLSASPAVPRLLARTAAHAPLVARMIDGTGSTLEPAGVEFYRRLCGSPGHVASVLGMFANWDLRSLARDLPRLATPLLLLAGESDRSIAPGHARRVQAMVPGARLVMLPGLGHLAHEERPGRVSGWIVRMAREVGLPADGGAATGQSSNGSPTYSSASAACATGDARR